MDNDLILRGLRHLFSEDTIKSFLFTIIFLYGYDMLERYRGSILRYKWVNRMITAWGVMVVIFLITESLQHLASFISIKAFGDQENFHVNLGDAGNLIFLFTILPLQFVFYLWVREYWRRAVKDIVKLLFIEAVFIVVMIMGFMLSRQIQIAGFSGILYAMVRCLSAGIGCAIAFAVYNYRLYNNKLKMREKELYISRLQQQLAQSQLDALSSKINPHFLYNSLNSIAGLATSDGLKTKSMAIALSKLFRYNINKEESNYVRIKEELEMVLIYLEIEKIRFGERLQYSSDIPPILEDELIPRHLLQPLVENAVKHGGTADHLEINISVTKKEKDITLCVADYGKPFDLDFSPGYGIKSLYDKLDLLTSGNYEITFENNPKQVCITISDHKKIL